MNGLQTQRYILLSEEGVTSPGYTAAELLAELPVAHSMSRPETASLADAGGGEVQVIDAALEDGPRLVEADPKTAESLNLGDSPLQMVPEVEYPVPNPPLQVSGSGFVGGSSGGGTGAPTPVTINCTDASSNDPVPDAHVVAFTDFANRVGGEGMTDAAGNVTLSLGSPSIERLYVYPPLAGYWGGFRQSLVAAGTVSVPLAPIDLSYADCVRHYYGGSNFKDDAGVEVGVIDTGVGPHRDLNLVSGMNTVTGEGISEFADVKGHGTHVSGLIGSGGKPPTGLRGLAPKVRLRAYRVFPASGGGATNYAILKAMIFAARDGCDIVNLSLGGGPHDPIVEEAVRDARDTGMLVVVAAGNDSRAAVGYPAAYPKATAVTAMGRAGTFPAGSLDESAVVRPPIGTDPDEFIAGFSNVGPQVAVTGPGVGALSTVPGDKFGAMSGTSMAAPVVSGAVACLLSQDSSVFGMARDAARSDAIEGILDGNRKPLGFGAIFEGGGLPDPANV